MKQVYGTIASDYAVFSCTSLSWWYVSTVLSIWHPSTKSPDVWFHLLFCLTLAFQIKQQQQKHSFYNEFGLILCELQCAVLNKSQ